MQDSSWCSQTTQTYLSKTVHDVAEFDIKFAREEPRSCVDVLPTKRPRAGDYVEHVPVISIIC